MVRTQIQLREKQAKQLKKLASAQHKSMAEVIRQAIDYMITSKVGFDIEERKKRAVAAAGRFHSGASDISERHDEYLVGAYRH